MSAEAWRRHSVGGSVSGGGSSTKRGGSAQRDGGSGDSAKSEDGGTTVLRASSLLALTVAPVGTFTAVTNALPPPTTMMTPMAMPTTSFVKLNVIYYYLFIYLYIDHANHAFLWIFSDNRKD